MAEPAQAKPAAAPAAAAAAAAPVKKVLINMNDRPANEARGFPNNFIKTSKYNLLTFLPYNLFIQFSKVSNFYFLVNMIFALIPGASPITPYSAVVPLVFVIGVALIKDGYEDYVRHQNDNRANSIKTHVVRKKGDSYALEEVESRDVEVGDIMMINNGDEVRADVLVLWTTGAECSAFIDTCNLDGETNLKGRKAVEGTWKLHSLEALLAAKLEVETTEPEPKLLSWGGIVRLDGHEFAVGIDQFLYRSCILKNTEHAWGVVLYAGKDTKMMMNLQEKPPKSSTLDYKLNVLIVALLLCQHALLFLMCSLSVWWNNAHSQYSYLTSYFNDLSGAGLWFFRYLSYFILMSYMIPISLFVTIELCKVAQAQWMSWDHDMFEWMNEKWVHCTPNTSNLNEQLSAVKFIFSDKTGTLTENVMTYKRGDILGNNITADDWNLSRAYLTEGHKSKADALKYFRALALCHTIQPFPDTKPGHEGRLVYDGASPDEVALVRAAVEHDVVLIERTVKTMTLRVFGKEEKYDILATLEFTPDRKMMSIIVRDSAGVITLFTKGADSFVIPNMSKSFNEKILPPTNAVLSELAAEGLRTLIVCTKPVTQEEFDAWYVRFLEAGKTLKDRSTVVDKVCLEMEREMQLIGITAIEDKLQDKVPETLQFFLEAGVIVWMLTGDKRETALTIAATSTLANPMEDYIIHIDIGALDATIPAQKEQAIPIVGDQLQQVAAAIARKDKHVSFVIDGPALFIAMDHHMELFLRVSQEVNSAVCCRLTPLQKANVVNMFQQNTGKTALAIGDGANDVSMIQEGRVGVGIVGLEGAQAALAADYAIPRFKHLRRLCCVHGRYAVARNALCIGFSFYKNTIVAMTQFYYAFFCGFSAQTLMDGWLLAFFNFAFTSIPPLFLGVFDKDLTEDALMDNAKLFTPLADGMYFDPPTIGRWFTEGLAHSLIIFFVMYPTMLRADIQEFRGLDIYMIGTIMMSCIIYLVLTKLVLHIRYWQGVQLGGFIFSYVLYICFVLAYSAIPNLFSYTSFYFQAYTLMSDAKYWLYILFFVVGLLFPIDWAFMFIQRQLFPTERDTMQLKYSTA